MYPAEAGCSQALPYPLPLSDTVQHSAASSDAASAHGHAMHPAGDDRRCASTPADGQAAAVMAGHSGPAFKLPQSWQVGSFALSLLGAEAAW
jgi:hypothetical protein